jgi:DNA mismatch repair protein MSH6
MDVVERADMISKDFAEKFKEKLQLNQEKNASAKMPLVAQADFAYMYKLATGQLQEEDPEHVAEVLRRMKGIARRYVEIRRKS